MRRLADSGQALSPQAELLTSLYGVSNDVADDFLMKQIPDNNQIKPKFVHSGMTDKDLGLKLQVTPVVHGSQELTLTIDEYSERYIKPAAIALAQQVETDLCGLYSSVPNWVGTAGTTPATFLALGGARRRSARGESRLSSVDQRFARFYRGGRFLGEMPR